MSAAASPSGSSWVTSSPVRRWVTWSGGPLTRRPRPERRRRIASPTTRACPRCARARPGCRARRSGRRRRRGSPGTVPFPRAAPSRLASASSSPRSRPSPMGLTQAGLGDDASDERRGAGRCWRLSPDRAAGEAYDRGPLAAWPGRVRPDRDSGGHAGSTSMPAGGTWKHPRGRLRMEARHSDDVEAGHRTSRCHRPCPPPPPQPLRVLRRTRGVARDRGGGGRGVA